MPSAPAMPASSAAGIADPDWDAAAIDGLRAREYARLDAQDQVYLDYTGGGLYADSQLREHQALLQVGVLGNPHSRNPTSSVSTELAEGARSAALDFFRASPEEYTVVFTANASAALKLVGESYPFAPGGSFVLSADDHNSVNGIREFARAKGAAVRYLPLTLPELRLDEGEVTAALEPAPTRAAGLFGFPAQSNYSGVQHPLSWIPYARQRGWDVLLDAAAFAPTNQLDLSRWQPDFMTISWYKLFGYPTGLGALIARREALARLRRPWFSGGSIGVASVVTPRHTIAAGETGFEDGTIDYLGLPGVEIGLRYLAGVGIDTVRRRVRVLTDWLLARMSALRHPNGMALVRLYGPTTSHQRGGTIAFNLLDARGRPVDFWRVEAAAAAARISLRTGCFCNPGASETARGITAEDMTRVFELGRQPSLEDLRRLMPDKALGAVRVSVGIATTERDATRFIDFLEGFADG